MLSATSKRNLSRILPYGVIWLIFSLVYTLLEKGLLTPLNYYPATGNPYSFTNALLVTPLTAFLTGILLGTLETLYFNKKFSQTSFGKKILYKSMIYLVLILFFLVFVIVVANCLQAHKGVFDPEIWRMVNAFLFSYTSLSVILFILSIILVTQFFVEVSENLSSGVLYNFFTGKYHQPIEEERIFMFLDMKSSTQIAESMGHLRYFGMLKEYYADLSAPITTHYGEVYQYAGDEIIVSWTVKNGLKDNNCIHCFLAMKAALQQQTGKYQQRFGLLPAFKAGFHVGKVTTGEIGVIKKEIVFTGDVLNTSSRIQGLCNAYGVDNLISDKLVKLLRPTDQFQLQEIGECELRGRDEKIRLLTVSLRDEVPQ